MWPKRYKYCMVPECKSSSLKSPDKLFFTIPYDAARRRRWCRAMGRVREVNPSTNYCCCEDHFDIENDMENYMKWKLVGVSRLKLKKGVVPHKFACQNYMSVNDIPKTQIESKSLHIKEEVIQDNNSDAHSSGSDTISCGSELESWLQEVLEAEMPIKEELIDEPIPESNDTDDTDPLALEGTSHETRSPEDKTEPYIVSMVYVGDVNKVRKKK